MPIAAIFNSEGVDYIYAVNDENRVYKKEVEILSIDGKYAQVDTDIKSGTKVITNGIKNINENDLVSTETGASE